MFKYIHGICVHPRQKAYQPRISLGVKPISIFRGITSSHATTVGVSQRRCMYITVAPSHQATLQQHREHTRHDSYTMTSSHTTTAQRTYTTWQLHHHIKPHYSSTENIHVQSRWSSVKGITILILMKCEKRGCNKLFLVLVSYIIAPYKDWGIGCLFIQRLM